MAEPNLNVEFSAVTDEKGKFRRLAKLLGLADADHARGKCEHLWLACTRRGETDLPQWLVEEILGERGPEALVAAELARWSSGRGDSKTRRLRIAGARKHCTWLASKSEQSSKGGKARASNASRVGGKFTRGPGDSITSPNQPSDSDSDPISDPEDQNLSLARAIPRTPDDGGQPVPRQPGPHATQQGAATPSQSTSSAAGNVAEPQLGPTPDRAAHPPSTGPLLLDVLWGEFELERQRVAKVLRIELLPLAAHDRGRDGLASALSIARRAGAVELEAKRIRLAIAVAGAEAEGAQDCQWLTGAVFTGDNLRRLSSTTPAKAKQAAAERLAAAQQRVARATGSQPAIAPPRKPDTAALSAIRAAQQSAPSPGERAAMLADSKRSLGYEPRAGPAARPPHDDTDDESTDENTA